MSAAVEMAESEGNICIGVCRAAADKLSARQPVLSVNSAGRESMSVYKRVATELMSLAPSARGACLAVNSGQTLGVATTICSWRRQFQPRLSTYTPQPHPSHNTYFRCSDTPSQLIMGWKRDIIGSDVAADPGHRRGAGQTQSHSPDQRVPEELSPDRINKKKKSARKYATEGQLVYQMSQPTQPTHTYYFEGGGVPASRRNAP